MPTDTPSRSGTPVARVQMTGAGNTRNVLRMRKPKFPEYEDFNTYLEDLMEAANIPHRAELSRLTDGEVDTAQLSNWKHGKNRPTREKLRVISEVLSGRIGVQVPLANLEVKAGLTEPDEYDLSGQLDFSVQRRQVTELVGHLKDAEDIGDPEFVEAILERVQFVNDWAELEKRSRQGKQGRKSRSA